MNFRRLEASEWILNYHICGAVGAVECTELLPFHENLPSSQKIYRGSRKNADPNATSVLGQVDGRKLILPCRTVAGDDAERYPLNIYPAPERSGTIDLAFWGTFDYEIRKGNHECTAVAHEIWFSMRLACLAETLQKYQPKVGQAVA